MPDLFISYEGNARRASEKIEAGWPDLGPHKPLSAIAMTQLDVCVAMNPRASVASFVGAITKEVDAAVARGQ